MRLERPVLQTLEHQDSAVVAAALWVAPPAGGDVAPGAVVDGRSLAGRGDRKRLTPISPMTHTQVLGWAEAAGFECRAVSGIRVFHDYLRERTPSETQLAQLAELEARFGDQEPYWRLGRYLHYCLYRPESS